jgi:methylenetetrahydrofolate reductase (NADPH)
MKINDKIKNLLLEDENTPAWYSYEYFPPKTYAGKYLTFFIKFSLIIGEENLLDRISRMASTNPLWVDMTWGAGGSSFDTTLDLCGHIIKYMGLDVLMHITCTGLTRERIVEALDRAKGYGIKNILALRGDPPSGVDNWVAVENGFSYAAELIKFIKEKYGDYFCIVAAGYPEVHL